MRFTLFINSKEGVIEYPLPAVNDRDVRIPLTGLSDERELLFEVYDGVWALNVYTCIRNETEKSS